MLKANLGLHVSVLGRVAVVGSPGCNGEKKGWEGLTRFRQFIFSYYLVLMLRRENCIKNIR